MAKKAQLSRFSEELVQTITYVHRLANSMLKRRTDALFHGKVTFPQYVALEVIDAEKSLKMKDIAKALKTSLPAVTGLINRLVSIKLVKRTYDQGDRRVIFVRLTNEGKRAIVQTRAVRKKIIAEIFSVLSEAERQTYLKILGKIKKAFYGTSNKG